MARSLVSGFDAVLASTVRTIHSSIEQDRDRIKVEIDERELPEFYRTARPDYFQLRTEDGRTVARSPSLKGTNLDWSAVPIGSFAFRSVRLPDGRSGRAVTLFFTPKVDEEAQGVVPPQRLTLTVARETTALDSQIRLLQVLLGAATGGTIILAVLAGTFIMGRGLRPLKTLASRIAAIGHDDLSTRIQVDLMPTEVVPVVHRLNDLLRCLEEAFCRERAFTADAAHELRTPLAGLRSVLEVALARPRMSQDYQQAMTECLDIVRQTQTMVEQLLALARLESGQTTLRRESLYLVELLDTAWRTQADRAQGRRISFVRRVAENLTCTTDRDNLLIAMSILLTNAVDYTNDEGRIEVVAEHNSESVKLTVANTGCRLTKEEALHVFERFWRGDASRTDTGIHCGLGLPLARRILTSLGGSIAADATGDIFAVRVVLPTALAT